MLTIEKLPRLGELRQLSSEIPSFPVSGLGTVQCAEHLGYDDWVINFLNIFPEDMVFGTRTDFLKACGFLRRLLKQTQADGY